MNPTTPVKGGASPAHGPSSNTGLSNFAGPSRSLSDDTSARSAAYLPSSFRPSTRSSTQHTMLHLAFDTLEWTSPLDQMELAGLLAQIDTLVGKGPLLFKNFDCVIKRVGGFHIYRIDTDMGLSWMFPALDNYKFGLRVIASPKYCLSMPDGELEPYANEFTRLLLDDYTTTDRCRLSRVDVALDVLLPSEEVQQFFQLVASKDPIVCSRSTYRAIRSEGDDFLSAQFGKEAVVLRVYDKGVKARIDGTLSFWSELWHSAIQPGSFPAGLQISPGQTVLRFEFQQRREFLRSWRADSLSDGISTLKQYRELASSVLEYLTLSWFRLAYEKTGHDNARETVAWWQGISALFTSGRWFAFVLDLRRDSSRYASRNVTKLAQMIAGCMSGLAAVFCWSNLEKSGRLPDVDDAELVFDYVRDWILEHKDRWEEGATKRFYSLQYGVTL
jgi:hypothetical protein